MEITYTSADIEKIKDNYKKIQEYVNEHYVPRIHKGDSISVKFGNNRLCSFWFRGNGEMGYSHGYLALTFMPKTATFERSIFESWNFGIELLHHWHEIKQLIEIELTKYDEQRQVIDNFEV